MPLYESPALILRGMRLGEADKLVTFFTSRYGKMKAVVKGALKPKARYGGRLEPFSLANIIVFGKEKADLYRLNTLDIMEPFLLLKDDLPRLGKAYVSAELVDICQREGDVNRQGFDQLLAFWRLLCQDGKAEKSALALRIFELKYLASIGFAPALTRCVACGKASEGVDVGFNARKGGVVCGACLHKDPFASQTSMGAIKLLARGMEMPMERLHRLSADAKLLLEIQRLTNWFIRAHVRREIRSEKFLQLAG